MKTNKSYKKRLKVRKSGKIEARKPGQNHFNTKESGRERLEKKNMISVKMTNRSRRRFLSNI